MEQIETLISEFIRNKINTIKNEMKILMEKTKEELEFYEKAYIELKKFEEKHRQELENIYIIQPMPWMNENNATSYLASVFEQISCFYHNLKRESERRKIELSESDYVSITYEEFERGTGLSSSTLKKYLEIMRIKETIIRERVNFGGYMYGIPKEEKVESAFAQFMPK